MNPRISRPWGWTTTDVENNPVQAALEHAYGNCPCKGHAECLCAVAAILEIIPKKDDVPVISENAIDTLNKVRAEEKPNHEVRTGPTIVG